MPIARAIVCGKGAVAAHCTDLLLEHNVEILAVVPDFDDTGEDGWRGSLLKYAKERGLPVRQQKLRTEESVAWLKDLDIDFIFSFQYYEILRPSVFTIPKKGTINLHFASLPKYRGCYPIAWAIINGEKEMGVTLHYIDAGIDTGDIIAQRFFPIEENDNARILFERCIREATTLFSAELPKILAGKNARMPQDNSRATYYPFGALDFSKKQIQWDQPSVKLRNWIRGFAFPPLQFAEARCGDITLRVAETEIDRNGMRGEPGSILNITPEGITVGTSDNALTITALASANDGSLLPMAKITSTLKKGDLLTERSAAASIPSS